MVNYGFGINNKGWKESKKNSLAKALKELVEDMEGEGKFIGLVKGKNLMSKLMNPLQEWL